VFGWGAQRSDDGHLDYTEWQLGGASIGGMMRMDENWPAEIPNHWLVYFRVADADATCERITSLGGSVKMPPMDIPPGRFAVVEDNQGAIFAILRFAEA
jgi:predicted enzyme related to lactoylglutathione lyase